jgi:hypothetical protein
MNTLNSAAGLNGRLPVPGPSCEQRDATASKIPYAGKEPPKAAPATSARAQVASGRSNVEPPKAQPLPAGTVIDGLDCSGMTDDPKRKGIPVYLQTHNRRTLTPAQLEQVKLIQAKARADEKAKKAMRIEAAKKLGISPTEMRKTGASLKSESASKKKSGKKPAAKKASAKKPTAAAKPAKSSSAKSDGPKVLRPGSKSALIADMLRRKEGCTTEDVLKATGWPAVSMPQQARVAGIALVKKKIDKVTHYFAG